MEFVRYSFFCVTEDKWKETSRNIDDPEPNSCPDDPTHVIDLDTITEIEHYSDVYLVGDDNSLIVKNDAGLSTTNPKWRNIDVMTISEVGQVSNMHTYTGAMLQGLRIQAKSAAPGDTINLVIVSDGNFGFMGSTLPEGYPLQSFGPIHSVMPQSSTNWGQWEYVGGIARKLPENTKLKVEYASVDATPKTVIVDLLMQEEY